MTSANLEALIKLSCDRLSEEKKVAREFEQEKREEDRS